MKHRKKKHKHSAKKLSKTAINSIVAHAKKSMGVAIKKAIHKHK
jgi:hypothetical protein